MTSTLLTLTEGTLDAAAGSPGLLVVDFWAAWCGPCVALARTLEAFAVDHAGRVRVGKVDVDAEPGLAQRFGIRSIPTLVFLQEGREVGRVVGAVSRTELERRTASLAAA